MRLNPLLTDLAGLDQITSVGNLVQITDNPSRLGADCSACVRNGPCPPPDHCPDDPAKLEPGICGCGVADLDTDRDGNADCVDPCPQDAPNDSDGDGVCNSGDQCPGFDDRVDADDNAVPDACQECVTAADCDDSNACTTDACSTTHCEHTAQSGTGRGSHGTCSNDAECIEPRCRFVPLGFASFTGTRVSEAYAVADDGTTVTGRVGSVETMAFRWREASGMVVLGWETARGLTISADGSRIAGGSRPSSVSFREQDGEFAFSDYYSYVYAGSSDGRVLAGKYGSVPMRWVEGGAIEILGTDGAHDISSQTRFVGGSASGVSADGSIIVGGNAPRIGCPGTPVSDSSPYVRTVAGILIQDYFQPNLARSFSSDGWAALVYNARLDRASMLSGMIWGTYKCINRGGTGFGGPELLGAPIGEQSWDGAVTRQEFEGGVITHTASDSDTASESGGRVEVRLPYQCEECQVSPTCTSLQALVAFAST